MILYVGCSYTWGSGLQYEYLLDKGWSAKELAEKSSVGATTIRRYEMGKGIPQATTTNMRLIEKAFIKPGIEFLGDPEVNPGVMLHIKKLD